MSSPASQRSAPRVLDQLPTTLRRRLSLGELAHAVLPTEDSFPIMVTIDRIDRYGATASKLSAAIKREFGRACLRGGDAQKARRRARRAHEIAFIHTHFLFTCWWAVRVGVKALRRSANRLGLPTIKLAIRPFNADLEHYAEGRSHFEHFEERLPGGENESMMRPRVYGGLHNGETFQFASGEWDISSRCAERLRKLGADLRAALIADLLELGLRRAPDEVGRYLRRLADTVRTEKLTRQVTKILALRATS